MEILLFSSSIKHSTQACVSINLEGRIMCVCLRVHSAGWQFKHIMNVFWYCVREEVGFGDEWKAKASAGPLCLTAVLPLISQGRKQFCFVTDTPCGPVWKKHNSLFSFSLLLLIWSLKLIRKPHAQLWIYSCWSIISKLQKSRQCGSSVLEFFIFHIEYLCAFLPSKKCANCQSF